jgi:ketosteroid isomerase-like protein
MTDDFEWQDPADALDLHPWLLSATDLLVSWAPGEEMQATPDVARRAWDRYFEPRQPRASAAVPREPEPAPEPWDAEAAEEVVDCLYRFIHAIERCDIAEVMECVAPDYHALDGDVEVDRDRLRGALEASIDGWRGEQFRVCLTEIPDVVFHPMGVLIRVTVQVDFWSRPHMRTLTELFGRLLWFRPHPDGRWLLAGMAGTNG